MEMEMEKEFAYQGTIVGPPTDDVCPICFDDFTTPSLTNCGHWFCADCILKYWYTRGGIQRCKCPKCDRAIQKLKVEASLFALDQDDEQNARVLERVMYYNLLNVGGSQFFSMVCFRAFHSKRKRYPRFLNVACSWTKFWYTAFIVRFIAFVLAFLCMQCGFDFIPTGLLTVYQSFDIVAIGVASAFCLVGLIRRFIHGEI